MHPEGNVAARRRTLSQLPPLPGEEGAPFEPLDDRAWVEALRQDPAVPAARLQRLQMVVDTYSEIPSYAISAEEREIERLEDNKWTYGDTPLAAVELLLTRLGASEHDVFFDAGSGCGRIVLGMGTRFGFRRAVGIEGLLAPHAVAEAITVELGLEGMEFYHELFGEETFWEADLIYCYGTCMEEKSLNQWFRNTRPGTRIVLATKELYRGFEAIDSCRIKLGDDYATTFYCYLRV